MEDIEQVQQEGTEPEVLDNAALDVQVEGSDAEQSTGGDPEVEAKAREWGWVPKDEFRGPAEKWRPADEFVQRGEEILPIVRQQKRDLEDRLSKQEADFEKRIERLSRANQTALERQKQQIITAYKSAERKAVESGDTALYDNLQKERDEALKGLEDGSGDEKEAEGDKKTVQLPQEVLAWADKNPWVKTDRPMAAFAIALEDQLQAENPSWSVTQRLDEVTKRVRKQFPDKFQSRQSAVDGGQRTGAGAGGIKASSKLPAEAKKAFEGFVRDGIYKPEELEDYAKSYLAEEGAR